MGYNPFWLNIDINCDILCILRYIMRCETGSFHFFSHRPGIETCSVTGFFPCTNEPNFCVMVLPTVGVSRWLQKRGSLSWLEGLQTFAQAHSLQVICKCPHQMLQLFPHQQIVRLNFFVRKATALQIALMQARPALGHQAYWHTRNAVEGTPN